MARRTQSSRLNLGIIVAFLLIFAAFVGSRLFVTGTSESFRTVSSLDVRTYLENANSLRGNVYKIEGEVMNSLAWSPSEGRLIAVGVEDGKEVVPVLVTKNFNHINIQKGQRFIFLLEVDNKGILRTKDMIKS
ncbi:MAG TPA: hypothetical protein VIS96_05715 [Terrimicrobiaceae bacterium]